MNPQTHAEISVRHRGGAVSDWFPLHSMMDASKEVESSNLHRCLTHHLFYIRQVMVPHFGATLNLTGGGKADVKDAMEMDHVCSDFAGRYLPCLSDYVALIRDDPSDRDLVRQFDEEHGAFYAAYPQVREHILAPLSHTGHLKACLLTMNSWWLNWVLPKAFPGVPLQIKDFGVKPADLFGRMEYADWVNNGRGTPPSFAKIAAHRKRRTASRSPRPAGSDVILDGNRGGPRSDVVFDGGPRTEWVIPSRAELGIREADDAATRDVIMDGSILRPVPEEAPPEGHEYVRDVDGVARGVKPISQRKPDHLID